VNEDRQAVSGKTGAACFVLPASQAQVKRGALASEATAQYSQTAGTKRPAC
jgi:hypothetical protein